MNDYTVNLSKKEKKVDWLNWVQFCENSLNEQRFTDKTITKHKFTDKVQIL